MEYVAPATLIDACRELAREGTRCLAGGQSLVALMNLGLAAPARLVGLRCIAGLDVIEAHADGSVHLGAMATHAQLAALDSDNAAARLLARAARTVASPAIRAQGTIGGAVSHADPAADYPAVLVAADAVIDALSVRGPRAIPARSFFRGPFATALAADELVASIRLPATRGGIGYEKLALVAGDFAIATVAAVATADGLRVAVGGCGPVPLRLEAAEAAFEAGARDDAALRVLGQALADASDPPNDQRASATYRRRVLPALVLRAARDALDAGPR